MNPGYIHRMQAVTYKVPPELLDERRRTGSDRFDEVWDGVIHTVPTPSIPHQDFEYKLEQALRSIAARRGLRTFHNVAIMLPVRGWQDYRVPDLCVVDPAQLSDRAVEGHAELVVEILSPGDE